jgi:hypothetical protein
MVGKNVKWKLVIFVLWLRFLKMIISDVVVSYGLKKRRNSKSDLKQTTQFPESLFWALVGCLLSAFRRFPFILVLMT